MRGTRLAVLRDYEGAVAAGPYFIQNSVDEIARISQFQSHPLGREPRFPESLKRPFEDGIFNRLFPLHPFLLVFAKLLAELTLHVWILRATMLHQFARHGIQYMKQGDGHIRRLAEQCSDVMEGTDGGVRIVDGDEQVLRGD